MSRLTSPLLIAVTTTTLYLRLGCMALLFPLSALAGTFAEGFSSSVLGGPADLRYRAFTIYTGQEACAEAKQPAELSVRPSPIEMSIGDQIHRSNVDRAPSELIIEAYGEAGEFLPAVPIVVSIVDSQGVTGSRSDWDYFEAIAQGAAELVVGWRCKTPSGEPLTASVRIVVVGPAE
jgi:hypothetical protein